MAAQLNPPSENQDCRELWRVVKECVDVVNAISNMKIILEGRVHMMGTLEVGDDSSKIVVREPKEVNG